MKQIPRFAFAILGAQTVLLTTLPAWAMDYAEMRVLRCTATEQGPQGLITRTGTIQIDMKKAKRILLNTGQEVPIKITPSTLSWEYTTPFPGDGAITISEVIERKKGVLRATITHVKDGRVVTKKQEQSTCTGLQ
ncbi:MAG: hypothetical protein EOO23_05195 [Comamonadaceae bacterium]|nr:MAG: hypothetical protein EOO23_05195 [Comamonadaceae bacterium]